MAIIRDARQQRIQQNDGNSISMKQDDQSLLYVFRHTHHTHKTATPQQHGISWNVCLYDIFWLVNCLRVCVCVCQNTRVHCKKKCRNVVNINYFCNLLDQGKRCSEVLRSQVCVARRCLSAFDISCFSTPFATYSPICFIFFRYFFLGMPQIIL